MHSLPPEHLVKLVIMHLIDSIMLISFNSNSKGLLKINPTGDIKCPINLLIGRNIINNLNPLQILIILNGIFHKKLIRQILKKMILNI